MNVAICCPGPSLNAATPADLEVFDAVLAVNRAALVVEATIWCALDYPMIRDHRATVLGNPLLMTHSTTWEDIRRKVPRFPAVVMLEDVEAWYGQKYQRRTTPAAMLLAGYLGASRIELFGDDKTPAPDFDGFQTAETGMARLPSRWESEQKDCDAITAFLKRGGCEVHRHVAAHA
jgi:hypothetical protein